MYVCIPSLYMFHLRISLLSAYILFPYTSLLHMYIHPVSVLCMYPISVCFPFRVYLPPHGMGRLFMCITSPCASIPLRMSTITSACESIPSSNASSLCVYQSSDCIYPLSVWVLSLCVSHLRVYLPVSEWVLSLCVSLLRVYFSSVFITLPVVSILSLYGSSLCVYLPPLQKGPAFMCISSPAPSPRVSILRAYCNGMDARARSGRRHIVYDAIRRSDRGKLLMSWGSGQSQRVGQIRWLDCSSRSVLLLVIQI